MNSYIHLFNSIYSITLYAPTYSYIIHLDLNKSFPERSETPSCLSGSAYCKVIYSLMVSQILFWNIYATVTHWWLVKISETSTTASRYVPAAPQHVVLDEARRRLALVHPARERRDELRRLDGAGAWRHARVTGAPWQELEEPGKFGKHMESKWTKTWNIWANNMEHMKHIWKMRRPMKKIKDLTGVPWYEWWKYMKRTLQSRLGDFSPFHKIDRVNINSAADAKNLQKPAHESPNTDF